MSSETFEVENIGLALSLIKKILAQNKENLFTCNETPFSIKKC